MPKTVKPDTALKHIQAACDQIIRLCNEMKHTAYSDKAIIIKSTNEFFEYYKNAVQSSNPFINNVKAMRAQGLWLPENINDTSVREVYFKVAKGKAIQIINNTGTEAASCTADRSKVAAILSIIKDINKYLDSLIEGRTIIDEN